MQADVTGGRTELEKRPENVKWVMRKYGGRQKDTGGMKEKERLEEQGYMERMSNG